MPALNASSTFTFKVDGLEAPLWVARFEGHEAISSLFHFELVLTSSEPGIVFSDVIGKAASLKLLTDGSEPRWVHGMVSRFEQGEEGKKLSVYSATLVPNVWRLQYRHDSRIFQELTVPAIIEKVLGGAGISDYRLFMENDHPAREYCVQYRESDWAFISRLMEEEGIFCFFEHGEDQEVLVIGDGPNSHGPIVAPSVLLFKSTLGAMAHGESVSRFNYSEEVRPGKVTLSDFNFKKPSLSLSVSSQADQDDDLEIYDYPGEYDLPGDGSGLAKLRLEELQSVRKLGQGESGCMRFTPGYLFELGDHGRVSFDRGYLITRVHHRGSQAQSGDGGGHEPSYSQSFQVIPDDVPYRPARRTPRPTIKGVQTAIVVGPSGEEVHTDEHGRVKVQFHWDRQGKKDDKSSCWIRVSQLWAGAGWGAMWIPRIGHEVIVDFIEGDPDRPIIVGRVYHGANVPPYPLPAEKTKSTIKSDSSVGGGGSNELRFEDKKGSEEIFLHGEKDWNIVIENDKTQEIGHDEALHVAHDRKKTVDNNQSETIGANKSIDVGKSHKESIGANESVTVGVNATKVVGVNQSEAAGGNRSITVGASMDQSVTVNMSLAVGGDKEENVGKTSSEIVGADKKLTVSNAYKIAIGKDMALSVEGDLSEEVAGEQATTVGKKITLECGEVKIVIEKSGKVTVESKEVTVKVDGPIKVEGKKLKVKSEGTVDVEASGAVKVKGSGVNIN